MAQTRFRQPYKCVMAFAVCWALKFLRHVSRDVTTDQPDDAALWQCPVAVSRSGVGLNVCGLRATGLAEMVLHTHTACLRLY